MAKYEFNYLKSVAKLLNFSYSKVKVLILCKD